jgi:histone H3/H4
MDVNTTNTDQDPAPTNDIQELAPIIPIQQKPPKRARTAYFIFMASKRNQVVAAQTEKTSIGSIAKIIGQLWNALPLDEKQQYQDVAAKEKVKYKLDLQLYKEQHANDADDQGNNDNDDKDNNANGSKEKDNDMGVLAFPLARIRKICRLDPEVKGISKEAAILVTKAAELFTARLGKDTFQMAQMQKKRRTLLVQDVVDVAQLKETFYFLKDDLGDLIRLQQKQGVGSGKSGDGVGDGDVRSGKQEKELSVKAAAAVANTKPLTSFFAAAVKK